ncbi:MAG TPA: 4-(cytidine 5'-diphospho)-2-C-methyl-D-erythritol kinase [Candidatus Acidoferrales bacterium]|nr:4-(cytidine 5'-diphospho)-2-C-methyl-D-erythritol kinase [Candidatus Acidoferrales bacterium]
MKLNAPAKLNLSLRILGKRADGYHLIDSLMVPISLYDRLEIAKARKNGDRITVVTDSRDVPGGAENLAYRAAALFLDRHGLRERVRIRIHKRIPVGAGLGGGSSDAASTILGLNRLFQTGMDLRAMAELGSRIGADVPFFIYGRPARVGGKGERVSPLSSLPLLWFVVLNPGFPVSTRWAYENFSVKLTRRGGNTSIIASLADCRQWTRALINDLEAVTLPRYPKLQQLKEELLSAGARAALMSGSGSSVFGLFESEEGARRAFYRLRKEEETRAYLVHSLS